MVLVVNSRLVLMRLISICEVVIMTYYKQLHPWCVIRILPNQQQLDIVEVPVVNDDCNVVARFRQRDDAEAYIQVLHNSNKDIKFLIIFDLQGVRNTLQTENLN